MLRSRTGKNEPYPGNDNEEEYEKNPIKKTIKNFDLHQKIKPSAISNDQPTKKRSGIFVSIFLTIVLFIVLWEESSLYFNPITEDFMMVDTDFNENLVINMDISFYKLRCSEIAVDAVDYNGEQQNNIDHEIYKLSRGDKQQDLGMYKKVTTMGDSGGETYLPEGYCGSCYGASRMENVCCNTCDELKRVYRRYGRAESLAETSPQCIREEKYGALPDEFGCRVRGTLRVNKMEGNFHIAAGSSHPQKHADHSHHIHHINKTAIQSYDISHHIHHLSFGELFYPTQNFPLDNSDFIAPGLGNLVYYIQLVPTIYETLLGQKAHTNQFSVYGHYTPVDTTQQHYKLPGVFFKYEFHPMRITYIESTKSFTQFIIRVFAILGGVYGIINIVYNLVTGILSFRSKEKPRSLGDIFLD